MIIQRLDLHLVNKLFDFDFQYSYIGIDFPGTVYVKNIYVTKDNNLYKSWIVLITYCSSRSTYSDLVPDRYGYSCIEALKWFNNICGAPTVIISDNGLSFSEKVKSFASLKELFGNKTWKALWISDFCGISEKIIHSMNWYLRKVPGEARGNNQELLTLLKEIENVLNNCTLTKVYYDKLMQSLTPNKYYTDKIPTQNY